MKTIHTKTSMLIVTAGIAGLLGLFPTSASSSELYFELRAEHSDKCLDVHNGETGDGANVKQWSCVDVPQQHWRVADLGYGYFELRTEHSGKCLDVSEGSTADGANVQQWECANVSQQRWHQVPVGGGYFELRAEHSGKCLDVDNGETGDGANVKQWTCAGVPQQHWKFVRPSSLPHRI